MKTYVQYRMKYLLHPWNAKMRASGVNAWCLVREIVSMRDETKPGEFITYHDIVDSKIVALFDLDSEAETFQRFLLDKSSVPLLVDKAFEEREIYRRSRKS